MSDEREERDAHGKLTAWAQAFDAIVDAGCDCGTDEPGTCLGCRCERALRAERAKVDTLRTDNGRRVEENTRLRAEVDTLSKGLCAQADNAVEAEKEESRLRAEVEKLTEQRDILNYDNSQIRGWLDRRADHIGSLSADLARLRAALQAAASSLAAVARWTDADGDLSGLRAYARNRAAVAAEALP